MKPRKAILTAAAVTAVFSAGGCVANTIEGVYGPPPDYTTGGMFRYETLETADNSGAADFDPYYNMEQPEYGAPVIPSEYSETAETVETTETSETTDASEVVMTTAEETPDTPVEDSADEDSVMRNESAEEPLIPELSYDPEMNMETCVYGPPEWFD